MESLIRIINHHRKTNVQVKSILMVAYRTVEDLYYWSEHYEKNPAGGSYGVIRAVININI